MDILQDPLIVVNNSGEILWKSAIHVKALCDGDQLGDWPRDIHACKLLFGFATDYDYIMMHFNDAESSLVRINKFLTSIA